VDPANILAITFTRKAAAEMRERIVATLRAAAAREEIPAATWQRLRDRLGDIAISTIDAFCLSLLREFPLEAGVDPGFSMADETEVPRLVDEALDRALRICRAVARDDPHVALVFAQLGDRRARAGLAALLNRRIAAPGMLSQFLAAAPAELTLDAAIRRGAEAIEGVFASMRGGLERFLATGPADPAFAVLAAQITGIVRAVRDGAPVDAAVLQAAFARLRDHFLTRDGAPRKALACRQAAFPSAAHWRIHRDLVVTHAPAVAEAQRRYRRDLNALVARGVWRMYRIAESAYRRTLEAHAVVDFSEALLRSLDLLRQMEEFSQSRYRLESRYHHVLVDEFQDTSRAQWELVRLLVASWGEGEGLAHAGLLPPSIFIVGDRKQSIYGFRDADVAVLREASRYLETLRPGGDVRRSISRSFRSVPAILSFVNDVCAGMEQVPGRSDAFVYEEDDRFPVEAPAVAVAGPLGLVVAETGEACAEATAAEIERLIASRVTVRDRETGVPRAVRPGDVAILFRSRESHRAYEEALERRGIPAYVYKGLGFFDADEIKDVLALLWYLAEPWSDLRAAAWLRSRFVRLSDEGLRRLAPHLAEGLTRAEAPDAASRLDPDDGATLDAAREAARRWLGLVDRMPPAELLDVVLTESAYACELRGPRAVQARENLKKIRALVRRIQNRGYATLGRIVAHLDRLALGDEANAVVDASDAVSLMTVHAAKGLEFPVVFVVNLARGTGGRREPIRVSAAPGGGAVSVSVGDFLSDADEDQAAREREETKRLLYVALTRARDRLYLGSVLKDGRLQPGRGSLAEVLPSSLVQVFEQALRLLPDAARSGAATQAGDERSTAGPSIVEWRASSGARHVLCVCAAVPSVTRAEVPRAGAVEVDCGPLSPALHGRPRESAAASAGVADEDDAAEGAPSTRLVGTVVHRLLEQAGRTGAVPDDELRAAAVEILRRLDTTDGPGAEQAVEASLGLWRALRGHPEISALFEAGEVFHEVPFTLADEGRYVRGTIDCLVRLPGGRIVVVEFKTGRRHPAHERQVALYRRAAEALFPGAPVEAWLVYHGDVARA
ncbi:MAG TPA: UvrD-helicase domain-containing protein, partial [Vicinamibacterales bacterium]|nr:UvrD-helicase domain-containing protein [Vicinamibacterales bacterium]